MIDINNARRIVDGIADQRSTKVCDYKGKYYMFVNEGSTPFYIVDKSSGAIRFLNPLEDFDAFDDALNNRVIETYSD